MLAGLTLAARALLDLFFPPRCLSCGASGAVICASCMARIQLMQPPICARCGRTLSREGAACGDCAQGYGPMALTTLRAAAVYDGVTRDAILALKYRRQRRAAEPLGDLLAAAAQREGYRPELIVPVPLHAQRRRERGYNQAELLARHCAARLGAPCSTKLLKRQRATRPQVGLSVIERRSNVVDAFALTSPAAGAALRGKRILLIDDVATTGSTLEAAAMALAAGGCAEVRGLAVARPRLSDDTRELGRLRSEIAAKRRGLDRRRR